VQYIHRNILSDMLAPKRTWNKSCVPVAAVGVVLFFLFVLKFHVTIDGVKAAVPFPDYRPASPLVAGTSSSIATFASRKRKAIITSVQRKDETSADWLAELLPDWENFVYVTDRTSDEDPLPNNSPIRPQPLPVNRGREASVYLTYIIHHYYDLPDYMVFIHGKRYQIHNGI
jgi:hypothetical protein